MNRLPFLIHMMENESPELAPKYIRAIQEYERRLKWKAALSEDEIEEDDSNGKE